MDNNGQIALFMQIALVIVILFVVLYFNTKTSIDRDIQSDLSTTISYKKEIVKEKMLIEDYIQNAITTAAKTVALHGGFTPEPLPVPNIADIPYWYYMGNKINIPSEKYLNAMLKKEFLRIIEKLYDKAARSKTGKFSHYNAKIIHADVVIYNTSIIVEADTHLSFQYGEHVFNEIFHTETQVYLRLGEIYSIAREFIEDYDKKRYLEESFYIAIKNDNRIYEPPGRIMETVACNNPPFKIYDEQIIPMKQNLILSAAMSQKKIDNFLKNITYIDISLTPNKNGLNFSFHAENGKYGHYNTRIYHIPVYTPPFFAAGNSCFSYYFVRYNISFPVEVTITDTLSSTGLVSTEGSSLLYEPLRFKFYIMAYISYFSNGSVDLHARLPLQYPEFINSSCQGSCQLSVDFLNSEKGTIYLDECEYSYISSHILLNNLPCREAVLKAYSIEPPTFAPYISIKKRNIRHLEIRYSNFSELSGGVYGRKRILCKQSKKIIEKPLLPLKYLPGKRSARVDIYLFSAAEREKTSITTYADSSGRYRFTHLTPGRYIIIARPSVDRGGFPTYKYRVTGSLIELKEGLNRHDIIMEPIHIEYTGTGYIPVSEVEDC